MTARWIAWWNRGRQPRIPDGLRVYAVGDVHGQNALLHYLISKIADDAAGRPAKSERVIFLGDLIDRGPGSASILSSLYAYRFTQRIVVLLGNHEAAMLAAYDGNRNALKFWLKFGGVETLASFGLDVDSCDFSDLDATWGSLRRHVPLAIITWLRTLPTSVRIGDYLFVHAGIRPGIRLRQQKRSDLLWIRDEFLASEDDHGVIVVHGHSVSPQVEFRANRIGIDTGAYETGILSAIGIEGTGIWTIST